MLNIWCDYKLDQPIRVVGRNRWEPIFVPMTVPFAAASYYVHRLSGTVFAHSDSRDDPHLGGALGIFITEGAQQLCIASTLFGQVNNDRDFAQSVSLYALHFQNEWNHDQITFQLQLFARAGSIVTLQPFKEADGSNSTPFPVKTLGVWTLEVQPAKPTTAEDARRKLRVKKPRARR